MSFRRLGGMTFAFCAGLTLLLGASAVGAEEADIQYSRDQIEMFKNVPEFIAPGPSFDARSCMAGKKVISILNNSTNPFLVTKANAMRDAAEMVGFEFVDWKNQGRNDQWANGILFAIQNGFDLIDLAAVDPGLVVPQVQEARDAGIITKTGFYYDASQKPHQVVDGWVPMDYASVGRLIANWVIAKTNSQARVVVVGTDEFLPTAPYVKGFRDELAKRCPECELVQYINVPGAEWATKTQNAVQTALLAHDDVNYVFPIYDSMSQYVVPAIELVGKTDQVKIVTYNGTPFVLDMVREGKVEMDVGQSLGWAGRAVMDSHLRSLCGLETPDTMMVPVRIFDETNIKEVGQPASYDAGFGEANIEGFRKLWGVK